MKTIRALFCVLVLSSSNAFAWVATEGTQIMNNIELILQYGQQIVDYQNQLQQYQTMLRNLQANPLGVTLPKLNQMSMNMATLMSYGRNISSSIAQIDDNFARVYDNPVARDFAGKFKTWTGAMQDGLKSAMRNAGMHREQFEDDTSALQALMSNLAGSEGNLSALQALGSLNARQIQESMKLRDLISEQQVAQSNYMLAQSKKEQEKEGLDEWIRKGAVKGPMQRPWETTK